MALNVSIIATGQIVHETDPMVALLIANEELTLDHAVRALACGFPLPYAVILGEIPVDSASREFCDAVGVDPHNAAQRIIAPERAKAIADDIMLRFELEGSGSAYILDRVAAFASAGASISVNP